MKIGMLVFSDRLTLVRCLILSWAFYRWLSMISIAVVLESLLFSLFFTGTVPLTWRLVLSGALALVPSCCVVCIVRLRLGDMFLGFLSCCTLLLPCSWMLIRLF